MDVFLNSPAVRRTLPPDFAPDHAACLCGPRINVLGSEQPYGDRIVFIGDCGVNRLYKDGIGAAYRAAKIAAGTAVFEGISADAFRKHYRPFCKKMERDNQIGKFLFKMAGVIQKKPFGQRVLVSMISSEQKRSGVKPYSLSMVLWDMLTGGAPYSSTSSSRVGSRFRSRSTSTATSGWPGNSIVTTSGRRELPAQNPARSRGRMTV